MEQSFFIVMNGNLAISSPDVNNVCAVQQADLSPKFKLSIGDYVAIHSNSPVVKLIAMEPVEYLVIPMEVIDRVSETAREQIESEKNEMMCDADMESFKRWALQFTLAAQKHVTNGAGSPVNEGISTGLAKITMKQFSKDLLLHLSPENELDHTLECIRNSLMSAFGAKRVRIYLIDHVKQQLVVKVLERRYQLYGCLLTFVS